MSDEAKGFVCESHNEQILIIAISPEEALQEAKSWMDAGVEISITEVYNSVQIVEGWRFH